MAQFERITFDEGGTTRSVILRDITEMGHLLTGIEVANDSDGCGWHDVSPAGFDQRQRIIGLSVIQQRRTMVEDRTYGRLVYPTYGALKRGQA